MGVTEASGIRSTRSSSTRSYRRNGGHVFAEERQQLIVELVAARGRASVTALAERLSITTETVRRDLAALEIAGTVRRVHGGAVSPERFSTTEESILERTVQRQSEKTRIAKAALDLIPQGRAGSILIDAGSTTEALAEMLAARTAGAGSGTPGAGSGTAGGAAGSAGGGAGEPELVVITQALPIATKLSG